MFCVVFKKGFIKRLDINLIFTNLVLELLNVAGGNMSELEIYEFDMPLYLQRSFNLRSNVQRIQIFPSIEPEYYYALKNNGYNIYKSVNVALEKYLSEKGLI